MCQEGVIDEAEEEEDVVFSTIVSREYIYYTGKQGDYISSDVCALRCYYLGKQRLRILLPFVKVEVEEGREQRRIHPLTCIIRGQIQKF